MGAVTADGTGVVALAGAGALRLLADNVGLTKQLSSALTRRNFVPVHDRGQVLVDLATVLAAVGEAIVDINTLRHEPAWGSVASPATVWRSLEAVTPAVLGRISKARAKTRSHVWSQLPNGVPASRVAGKDLGETVVIDIDATLVTVHSDKNTRPSTTNAGTGSTRWVRGVTTLVRCSPVQLRPGNAGANNAADHITVLTEAISQVPASHRRSLLVRADSAGATLDLLNWVHDEARRCQQSHRSRLEYSIDFPVHKGVAVHDAITQVPEAAWQTALNADGEPRVHAGVVEITDLVDLTKWPAGMRLVVRREKPHPGAALTLFEQVDGWRYQAFVTNTTRGQLGFLEARHRAHARVEDRIRVAKDTGLGRPPSRDFAINTVWIHIAAIAADLTCWLQLLALHDQPSRSRPRSPGSPPSTPPRPDDQDHPPTPTRNHLENRHRSTNRD